MILLCRNRTKRFLNYANKFMTSFFLSFFFCFKHLFYLFYWIQLCLLIYAHRHQIPLRTALSELIGSDFLFILTVGELHCRLNSSSSWMELFAERSRKGAGLGDASCLSQGENCFCSHNSHNISPFLACSSEGPIWRGGEWFRWFSVCLLSSYVCAFFFFFFLSVKKWKAFQGLICPIVHLLLTKVYSLLLAQHLPWILAITFPLEDAFVM